MSIAREEYYKALGNTKYLNDTLVVNKVNPYIQELEQQKAELIATLSMALSTPHRNLYLQQMKETLKKYD